MRTCILSRAWHAHGTCTQALIFFAPGVATFLVLLTAAGLRGPGSLQIETAYMVLGLECLLIAY